MVTKMAASSSDHRLQGRGTRSGGNNCSGLHSSSNASISANDASAVGCGGVTAQSTGAAGRLASLLGALSLSTAKPAQRPPHQNADEEGDKRVKLDVEHLRELVFAGGCCCESDATADSSLSTRPIAWRILLGVLDENPVQWSELLAEKRHTYADWKREFLGCKRQSVVGKQPRQSQSDTQSSTATAKDAYDQDVALMKEIDKVL